MVFSNQQVLRARLNRIRWSVPMSNEQFVVVPCRCGGDICGLNRDGTARKVRYKCRGCRRWVPWCFGAADNLPHHCDDCWTPPQCWQVINCTKMSAARV